MTIIYYMTGIALAIFLIVLFACISFQRIECEELPKDPSMEAFKAATKPKPKLKEMDK